MVETFLDKLERIGTRIGSVSFRLLGFVLCFSLYGILITHVYAFFTVISPLLKKRFGTGLGLLWIVVGLALLYNIVWNHVLASVLKPGSTLDRRETERMR